MTRLLVLLALVSFTMVLDAQSSRFPVRETDTLSRTLRAPEGRDRLLEVSLVDGSIHVVGDDGDDIHLAVKKTIDAASEADARDADAVIGLEVLESTGALRIRGDAAHRPGCDEDHISRNESRRPRYRVRFDVDLRVPRGTNLHLCTVNGGAVDVAGTAGSFDVGNVNGAITLTDVAGSGRAVTVNGPVTATFVENPGTASRFTSVNGDIDVTFRRNLSANLRMKTFNGGLYTDFAVTRMPGLMPAVERIGARVFYKADRYTTFRVGSGGPELTFDTLNGDVRILGKD